MRAQTVYENIEFQRGRDPKRTLGIGRRVLIEKWFEEWAPEVEYEIDDNFDIYLKNDLILFDTNVTSLPNNLRIYGNLYLVNTLITSLPDNLEVEGWLDITNTKITSLPDDLEVVGKIYKDF